MIKTIKTRFSSNLGLGCVHILNYAYAWLKLYACKFDDVYMSFNKKSGKSHFYKFNQTKK